MAHRVLTLQLLSSISMEELANIVTLFSQEYSPIGDCETPEEGLQYFQNKTVSWVILEKSLPVGLIALSPSLRHGMFYQTTTYIFPQHRGQLYNQTVKDTFAQSFLRNPKVKLCSVVRDWNMRSQKAMLKTFPTIIPAQELRTEQQQIKDPTIYQWFYDLSQVPFRELGPEEEPIHSTLTLWVEQLPVTDVTLTVMIESIVLEQELLDQTSVNNNVSTHAVA